MSDRSLTLLIADAVLRHGVQDADTVLGSLVDNLGGVICNAPTEGERCRLYAVAMTKLAAKLAARNASDC